MDKENEIKLSLTTVIILFLVFIVIVVLGGMYFCSRCIPKLKEELSVTPDNIKEVVTTNIKDSEEQKGNNISVLTSKEEISSILETTEEIYTYVE